MYNSLKCDVIVKLLSFKKFQGICLTVFIVKLLSFKKFQGICLTVFIVKLLSFKKFQGLCLSVFIVKLLSFKKFQGICLSVFIVKLLSFKKFQGICLFYFQISSRIPSSGHSWRSVPLQRPDLSRKSRLLLCNECRRVWRLPTERYVRISQD